MTQRQNRKTVRISSVLGAAVVGTALAAPAWAAGYALKEQSAIDQGAAFAGATARSDDPSSLFFNPASMARLPGYQVSVGGALIGPQSTLSTGFGSRAAVLGGAPITGTLNKDAAVNAFVPSIYATAQLGQDWHVGLSITSPFGLATKYDTSSLARYYALTSSVKTINIAPAVAWQILPTLALGAALNIETMDAHLSNAADFGGIGAASGLGRFGLLPGTADGIATLKGSDTVVGWQIGGLWEPVPGTRVGANYRSAMFHKLSGTITYQGVPGLLSAAFPNVSATAKVPEPASATIGIAHDIGAVTLLADVGWTGWSSFKSLIANTPTSSSITQENWHDAYNVSLGADWRVNEQWTLRAGTQVDQSPVDSSYRTPRIADGNRYWLSVGATWRPIPKLAVSAAYSHLFVPNTTSTLVDAGPGTTNFTRGNLTGTYKNAINILSMQLTYQF